MIGAWENIQLIRGTSYFRFGNVTTDRQIGNDFASFYINNLFVCILDRTPFELNTACCIMIALFNTISGCSGCLSYFVMICLFNEIASYTKTFIVDIKSMFDRMDRLTKSKSPDLPMLKYCKEAIELHSRTNE